MLLRRLSECPGDCMATSSGNFDANVAAVVSDMLIELGGAPDVVRKEVAHSWVFASPVMTPTRNLFAVVLIAAWLLYDSSFRSRNIYARARDLIFNGLDEFAEYVPARDIVNDPDRREEFARLCLKLLDLHPAGETEEQANDRLASLNSAERARVVKEARAAEARAEEIRKAMARKAAEEAAAAYGRE